MQPFSAFWSSRPSLQCQVHVSAGLRLTPVPSFPALLLCPQSPSCSLLSSQLLRWLTIFLESFSTSPFPFSPTPHQSPSTHCLFWILRSVRFSLWHCPPQEECSILEPGLWHLEGPSPPFNVFSPVVQIQLCPFNWATLKPPDIPYCLQDKSSTLFQSTPLAPSFSCYSWPSSLLPLLISRLLSATSNCLQFPQNVVLKPLAFQYRMGWTSPSSPSKLSFILQGLTQVSPLLWSLLTHSPLYVDFLAHVTNLCLDASYGGAMWHVSPGFFSHQEWAPPGEVPDLILYLTPSELTLSKYSGVGWNLDMER